MAEPLIVASGIVKGYRTAAGHVPVLEGLDLTVEVGEMLAIMGVSGVGKSTLLHVLGTLDRPEAGSLVIAGEDMLSLPESRLREVRNRTLGFVFQFHHLLPEFTALENVMMPLLIARKAEKAARERAESLLGELELGDRLHHRPGALSGGEQQRVALARGLAQGPRALLADEPTGNLDRETGGRLQELVVVTHDEELAHSCDRTLRLASGRLHPPGLSG
jgi:lipoprotein-releasing system ATP-binding protein